MKKILFVFSVVILTGSSIVAQSQPKGKVCVWVDSEEPGSVMAGQPGGAISHVSKASVNHIRQMAVAALKTDKSNFVVDPCPQSGENIEIDVVVGLFRGGYVASVSTTQGGKEGGIHVSSNVIGASTEELLAEDVAIAYESLKIRAQTGTTGN